MDLQAMQRIHDELDERHYYMCAYWVHCAMQPNRSVTGWDALDALDLELQYWSSTPIRDPERLPFLDRVHTELLCAVSFDGEEMMRAQ
jgi:hypothetical protein